MKSKKMPGYARYIVFEDGTVKNIATGNVVVPDISGYGRLRLVNDDGARVWYDINKELKNIFPPEPDIVLADVPGLKITASKELIDKIKKRREPKPTKEKFILPEDLAVRRKLHRPGKISPEQVAEIRARAATGELKSKHGPKEYGICPQTLGKIIQRKIYTNLP